MLSGQASPISTNYKLLYTRLVKRLHFSNVYRGNSSQCSTCLFGGEYHSYRSRSSMMLREYDAINYSVVV